MIPDKENRRNEQGQGAGWSVWEFLLVMIAAIFLSALPAVFADRAGSLIGLNLVAYLLQEGCFFLLPLLLVTVLHGLPASALGFVRPRPRVVVAGLVAGLLLYAVNIALSTLSALLLPAQLQEQQSILTLFDMARNQGEVFLLALFTVTLAPLGEEVLFRAFLLPPLRSLVGRWPAFLICGVIFAGIHLNLLVFLPLFAGGVGFAWLYDRYGNICCNVIAHAVWNAVALTLFFTVG